MRTILSLIFGLLAVLISGCGPAKSDADKISKLESRISLLESNITVLTDRCDHQRTFEDLTFQMVSNQEVCLEAVATNIRKIGSQYQSETNLLGALARVGSAPGGLADSIDPTTGFSTRSSVDFSPHLVKLANRVTEANSIWWKWAFTLYLGNPSYDPVKVSGDVQFLDEAGFIIETKSEYNLKLPPMSTNAFSDYALVDMPGAQRVRSIKMVLDK